MNKKVLYALFAVVGMNIAHSGALQAAEPIKIGAVLPLSGPVAYDGQAKQHGAMVAIEQINAAGGVLGRPLELVAEDGACIPAQSVSAAEKLVTDEEVSVLMGAFCSSSTGAVMGVSGKYGVPHITSVSTAADLTERGNRWFFRATDTSKLMAENFAPAIIEFAPNKRAAILVVNDDWGRTVQKWYGAYFEELGGKIVSSEIFDRAETDLFPYITKIKARNPDVIIMAANTQLAASLTKQMRQMDVQAKLIGEGAFSTQTYYNLVGELSEGVYGITEYVPTIDTAQNEAFVAAYKARAGELPTKFSMAGYQDVQLLADAISRAGSLDPASIRDALESTDYNGITGNIRFTDKHQGYNFNVYLSKNVNMTPDIVRVVQISKPE